MICSVKPPLKSGLVGTPSRTPPFSQELSLPVNFFLLLTLVFLKIRSLILGSTLGISRTQLSGVSAFCAPCLPSPSLPLFPAPVETSPSHLSLNPPHTEPRPCCPRRPFCVACGFQVPCVPSASLSGWLPSRLPLYPACSGPRRLLLPGSCSQGRVWRTGWDGCFGRSWSLPMPTFQVVTYRHSLGILRLAFWAEGKEPKGSVRSTEDTVLLTKDVGGAELESADHLVWAFRIMKPLSSEDHRVGFCKDAFRCRVQPSPPGGLPGPPKGSN